MSYGWALEVQSKGCHGQEAIDIMISSNHPRAEVLAPLDQY